MIIFHDDNDVQVEKIKGSSYLLKSWGDCNAFRFPFVSLRSFDNRKKKGFSPLIKVLLAHKYVPQICTILCSIRGSLKIRNKLCQALSGVV